MEDQNSKKTIVLTAAAIAVVGALSYFVFVPKKVSVDTAVVQRKEFIDAVKADGLLRSKQRFTVTAFADGEMKRMDYKVGDPLKKKQKITELYWDVKFEPVQSPIDGVITKVFRESAGPIRRGEPIIEVVDPNTLEAIAEMLTSDAARLSEGAHARIEGWGGDQPIQATVARVSKAGFTKVSALGVEEEKTEVILEMRGITAPTLAKLGHGFHIDVTIEIARHPQMLVIPTGALFRDGADWAVYKIQEGRAVKTSIALGARGSTESSVAKGLNVGETIIVYPGDLVKPGTRVVPKK